MRIIKFDGFDATYTSDGITITKTGETLTSEQLQDLIDTIETFNEDNIPSEWYQVGGEPSGFPAEPWIVSFLHQNGTRYYIQLRYQNSIQVNQHGSQDVNYGLYCEVYNDRLEKIRFQGMMTARIEYIIDDIIIYIKTADFGKFLYKGEFPFEMYIGIL